MPAGASHRVPTGLRHGQAVEQRQAHVARITGTRAAGNLCKTDARMSCPRGRRTAFHGRFVPVGCRRRRGSDDAQRAPPAYSFADNRVRSVDNFNSHPGDPRPTSVQGQRRLTITRIDDFIVAKLTTLMRSTPAVRSVDRTEGFTTPTDEERRTTRDRQALDRPRATPWRGHPPGRKSRWPCRSFPADPSAKSGRKRGFFG